MSHSRVFVCSFGFDPDESKIGEVDIDTLYEQLRGAADYTDYHNEDYEDDLDWLSSVWGIEPDCEDKCGGKTVRGYSLAKLKHVLKDRLLNGWQEAAKKLESATHRLLEDEFFKATMSSFEARNHIKDTFGFYFYVEFPEAEQTFILDSLLPSKEKKLWILETFDYHY